MILHGQIVEQRIDGDERGHFVKELVLARGPVPIAMVRKRLAKSRRSRAIDSATEAAAPTRATLLLIHGFGQNRYAFHLPARSMVNQLARAGFDVYNVDLRGRGRSGHFGAERPSTVLDFVHEDLPTALSEIQEISGARPVFLVGHSLGGAIAYCMAVDRPGQVAGVVSIGTPYHFTLGARWLAAFGSAFLAIDRRFGLPNAAVPTRALGSLMRVTRRFVESPLYPFPLRGFHRGSIEPEVLDQHLALAMDIGSISTMRAMFAWASEVRAANASDASAQGLFGYGERFEALDVPLLIVAGKHDDMAPPASVKPGFERSQSSDKTYRELPFGHLDLLVGRDAPLLTWPLIESWLGKRAERAAKKQLERGAAA